VSPGPAAGLAGTRYRPIVATKAEQRAARERVSAYHQAQLAELLSHVGAAIDRYSPGEKLQKALPETKVVKTMNTAAMTVLTEPGSLGPSSVFLSGDDDAAKATVAGLLRDLGWSDNGIVDLGGIATTRGVESYFPLLRQL
jgi:hypothetical protein